MRAKQWCGCYGWSHKFVKQCVQRELDVACNVRACYIAYAGDSTMFKFYFLIPPIIALALLRPTFGSKAFARLGRLVNRISLRTGRAVAIVGVLSLAICMSLTLLVRVPPPQVADEFGYLLIGDTLLHGRLSNPVHPLWQHFESIHIIHQPTYAAKYPPAQGLALAIGTLVGGHPIVGIWLSTALACATMCWMLFAWLPRRWAFFGGLLIAIHPLILTWSQSYWGGAVAMGGGALVSGAFRRLVDCRRVRDAVLMGLGIAILANSRPYEGFILTTLMLSALAVWIFSRHGPDIGFTFRKIVLPLVLVGGLVAVQIGYYNYRITGNPLRMPYIVHEETYGVAPLFFWQKPRPEPVYRHKAIHDLQVNQYLAYFKLQHTWHGFLITTADKIYELAQGYFWSFLLLIPLIGLPWALRYDGWTRFALLIGSLFTLCMLFGTWVFPHYAAPVMDLFLVVTIQSIRQARLWRWNGKPVGLALTRGIILLCVISVGFIGYRLAQKDENRWDFQRARILQQLENMPGKHVVIVRYSPNHNPHREWIYNAADIDNAKVIWAREMSPEENLELINYFKDRTIWVVDADDPHPQLKPFSPGK